jgi:hypothetical protein
MALSFRANANASLVCGSRQGVRGRQAPLVVPHAVKDVFMPALR